MIIIDARGIPIRSGIGRYLMSIIDCLMKDERKAGFKIIRCSSDDAISNLDESKVIMTRFKRISLLSFLIFPFVLYLRFGTGFRFVSMDYFGVPYLIGRETQKVVIIHDVMYRIIPSYFSRFNLLNSLKVAILNFIVFLSTRKSEILFVSKTSFNDFIKYWSRPRRYVISPPVSLGCEYNKADCCLNKLKPYALFVGGARYQKGFDRLENINFIKCGVDIRTVGHPTVDKLKEKNFVFLGSLSDEEYLRTMRRALVLVVPSYYEGFSIPVAEAISFGVPVIHSGAGALKEWSGGGVYNVDFDDAKVVEGLIESLLIAQRGQDYFKSNIEFINTINQRFLQGIMFLISKERL